MWLDMAQHHALLAGDAVQGFDLLTQLALQEHGRQIQRASAEVFAVGIAGVGAGRHAEAPAGAQRGAHALRVAGMPATGDRGRADALQQRVVIAAALADVGVQVDQASGHPSVLRNRRSSRCWSSQRSRAVSRSTGANCSRSPGRSWASFQRSAAISWPMRG